VLLFFKLSLAAFRCYVPINLEKMEKDELDKKDEDDQDVVTFKLPDGKVIPVRLEHIPIALAPCLNCFAVPRRSDQKSIVLQSCFSTQL